MDFHDCLLLSSLKLIQQLKNLLLLILRVIKQKENEVKKKDETDPRNQFNFTFQVNNIVQSVSKKCIIF